MIFDWYEVGDVSERGGGGARIFVTQFLVNVAMWGPIYIAMYEVLKQHNVAIVKRVVLVSLFQSPLFD